MRQGRPDRRKARPTRQVKHVHRWRWDDRSNHWCIGCPLWHDFPHEPGQDPADCKEAT